MSHIWWGRSHNENGYDESRRQKKNSEERGFDGLCTVPLAQARAKGRNLEKAIWIGHRFVIARLRNRLWEALQTPINDRTGLQRVAAGSTFLKPTEIAKLLRVSPGKVLAWIRQGDLKAVDVGEDKRSGYRVHQEDLSAFLASREVKPPPPHQRRQSRRPSPPEGGPIDPELGEKLLKRGEAVKVGKKYYRVWNGIIQFI